MATRSPPPAQEGSIELAEQRRAAVQGTTVYFPLGEPGPRQMTSWKAAAPPVKLLMNVEKLRLLTKAGTTVLLSAAERAGLSLSAVEWLGLLCKAEELEIEERERASEAGGGPARTGAGRAGGQAAGDGMAARSTRDGRRLVVGSGRRRTATGSVAAL
uniref:Uncharacterized protein n=1 Tax=Oryza glumipatula TaxID=40148 RepID=A0A0E0BIY9_9ORYZ